MRLITAGLVSGAAQSGIEWLLLEVVDGREHSTQGGLLPYSDALRAALQSLEDGQRLSGAALMNLHGELGRAVGLAIETIQHSLGGPPAAVACRGYGIAGNHPPDSQPLTSLWLGDLGLASAQSDEAGRLSLLPVVDPAAQTALDCARLAAALFVPAIPASTAVPPASESGPLTEGRNPRTVDIDRLPTLEMLRLISAEDALVAPAVACELPAIAQAVDQVAARMQSGGRLIYIGAGTSGRLGVLDASEVPPTYGLTPEWVLARIAGGPRAITQTVEASEDDASAGQAEIIDLAVGERDSVVGIAASGRTPYVLAAMREARQRGALIISLACNRPSPMQDLADIAIAPLVGPEAVAGSTRMKAGSAQKMVLNMLSTGVMIRLGKTFSNLMVDMQASNKKLRARAVRMVMLATHQPEAAAAQALQDSQGEVKTAIVMLLADCSAQTARQRLAETQGRVRAALTGQALP